MVILYFNHMGEIVHHTLCLINMSQCSKGEQMNFNVYDNIPSLISFHYRRLVEKK